MCFCWASTLGKSLHIEHGKTRDPLLPPTEDEWHSMADSVLLAARFAYAATHIRDFDFGAAGCKADVVAAIQNAKKFFRAMSQVTADALTLTECKRR